MKFNIDKTSFNSIQHSFDCMAKELIQEWDLNVNDHLYSFTEIEFYYYDEAVHKDMSTHRHDYDAGMWRAHSQGLDITFEATDTSDGGILIRGLQSGGEYTNGPGRVVTEIFKSIGSVTNLNKQFGLVKKPLQTNDVIYKVRRHGLSESLSVEFKDALYRYYVDIDAWNTKHVAVALKEQFKSSHEPL